MDANLLLRFHKVKKMRFQKRFSVVQVLVSLFEMLSKIYEKRTYLIYSFRWRHIKERTFSSLATNSVLLIDSIILATYVRGYGITFQQFTNL